MVLSMLFQWGVGVHEAGITAPAPWIDADAKAVRMVVSHQDQVTALPPGAEALASSDFCPIAMYHIGAHIFAMQAHPEFSRAYSHDLMEVRRGLIGDERIAAGSLARMRHEPSPSMPRSFGRT